MKKKKNTMNKNMNLSVGLISVLKKDCFILIIAKPILARCGQFSMTSQAIDIVINRVKQDGVLVVFLVWELFIKEKKY